jgi:hypothetical protein
MKEINMKTIKLMTLALAIFVSLNSFAMATVAKEGVEEQLANTQLIINDKTSSYHLSDAEKAAGNKATHESKRYAWIARDLAILAGATLAGAAILSESHLFKYRNNGAPDFLTYLKILNNPNHGDYDRANSLAKDSSIVATGVVVSGYVIWKLGQFGWNKWTAASAKSSENSVKVASK